MGLTSLNAALSGLAISQRQMDVISTNISNVGTEGYTRKTLPQYAQTINGQGVGVLSSNIMRSVDSSLTASMWTQVSATSFNQVKAEYLEKIEQFHGAPDAGVSISSELTELQDSFITLSDDPSDPFAQKAVVDQAIDMADKINDFSDYIIGQRNAAQEEITDTIRRVNDLLEQIADLNQEIERDTNIGRTTANAQDLRDSSVKELSGLMEISYFVQSSGTMVVQTSEGVELASTKASVVSFDSERISFGNYYPDNIEGIYVQSNYSRTDGIEITTSNIGGRLGGLIELRDETFPKQMAQLDELAHKMALRFEAQGLRLFTDGAGNIPADTAPDTASSTLTPVEYVGFSTSIQVNQDIINDNTLLQSGTGISSVAEGSNEVIRRILDYAFTDVNYEQAIGSINLEVSSNVAPNNTLQEFLGIFSSNTVTSATNLNDYSSPASFISATNDAIDASAGTFRITLEEADLSLGPVDIDIDLTAVTDGAGNMAQDIVDYITGTLVPALSAADQAALTSMNVQFGVGSEGGLEITSQGDITIDATSPANAMGLPNLAFLGLSAETSEATDPFFDISVGSNDFTRITLEPSDDETDLLAKLEAVNGLAVQYSAGGELQLRPGNDYDDPEFGGDLRIVSGASSASGAAANTLIGAGTVPDGVNIVAALFGSYTSGGASSSPVESVAYGSEVSATDSSTLGFREDYLGAGASISTGVNGSDSLLDYAQQMINEHSQELISVQDAAEDDAAFLDILEDQWLADSGVNIDEELSNLIIVQNAYSASAQVLETIGKLFDDLLAVI